jgi:hypothetical protein
MDVFAAWHVQENKGVFVSDAKRLNMWTPERQMLNINKGFRRGFNIRAILQSFYNHHTPA